MAWDWITPVGSAVVAIAGLGFGWATSVRSQRQAAELAKEGNRHARSLAELAATHAASLEGVRHEQLVGDRRDQRQEQSYLEIATTVIRLSATVSDAGETVPDELVRARVLVGLFAQAEVQAAFGSWLDRFDKLRFALGRQAGTTDEEPASTRDLHSKRDLWRRQANDARLREVDARERLIAALAAGLDRPTR
ncbi:hypothetical protein [Krasilnikovia sp. MM14-A1004]|uniref:hypothetical protein n=1 Tax=Krasilnikovia sp. MM14-A1004 TaxID=3373541 RepID=UPI00399C5478